MRIETKFSCGDTGYVFREAMNMDACGYAEPLTIGQVQVKFTKSGGLKRGEFFRGTVLSSDNTLPKSAEYIESYMCVQTGIGSGSVWELGKNIFATPEEAMKAGEKRMAEMRAYKAQAAEEKRLALIAREGQVRRDLALIEEAKATGASA